jgi:hypothetical protein
VRHQGGQRVRVLTAVWVVVVLIMAGPVSVASAQGPLLTPAPAAVDTRAEDPTAEGTTTEATAVAAEEAATPYFTWGNRKTFVGIDFSFLNYVDNSLHAAMGRERQMLPARMIISLYGDYSRNVSYRVEINPVSRSMVPRPYVPHENDRRTYFFPNQPDVPGGRGVASVPDGLFYVDNYKTMGVDPIHHLGALRVGSVDIHTASRRVGFSAGRVYVPQGLGLDNVTWFSAKDLVHMQIIDAAADNGVLLYYQAGPVRLEGGAVSGNASPFHDYGYFDFTAGGEDKNSAMATVARGIVRPIAGLQVGASVKHNYVNSRIEDSISLQLSKRYDNAFTGFARWQQSPYLALYGQVARYKWGQRDTSADLMPGVRPQTPIFKDGYFAGVEASTPRLDVLKGSRISGSYVRSEISRDDSLVSWAAANSLFGVTLGKKERSSVFKVQGHVGDNVSFFWFLHDLSNPFPELSAIRPIDGPGSDQPANNNKAGLGLMLKF